MLGVFKTRNDQIGTAVGLNSTSVSLNSVQVSLNVSNPTPADRHPHPALALTRSAISSREIRRSPPPRLTPWGANKHVLSFAGAFTFTISITFYGASQCFTLPRQVFSFSSLFRSCDLFVCLLLFSSTVFYDLTTYLTLR